LQNNELNEGSVMTRLEQLSGIKCEIAKMVDKKTQSYQYAKAL